MAIKESGNVTITLARTTVAMLRAKKKDLETWDELMQRLGRRQRCGIECITCGTILETTNYNITLNQLAEETGWVHVTIELDINGINKETELGYMCMNCAKKQEVKEK